MFRASMPPPRPYTKQQGCPGRQYDRCDTLGLAGKIVLHHLPGPVRAIRDNRGIAVEHKDTGVLSAPVTKRPRERIWDRSSYTGARGDHLTKITSGSHAITASRSASLMVPKLATSSPVAQSCRHLGEVLAEPTTLSSTVGADEMVAPVTGEHNLFMQSFCIIRPATLIPTPCTELRAGGAGAK